MSNPTDKTGFNVLDMAQDMADASGVDLPNFFRQPTQPPAPQPGSESEEPQEEAAPKKKKPWTPSAEAMAELPELQHQGVSYTKEEMEKFQEPEGLQNIADDNAKQSARDTMDELTRKMDAIETAKARHGILHFQIPEGPWQVKVHNAAIDVNWKRAQLNLDEVFTEIKTQHPEFIMEWLPGYGPDPTADPRGLQQNLQQQSAGDMIEPPSWYNPISPGEEAAPQTTAQIAEGQPHPDLSIKIDKTNVSQVSWTPEEVEKIRKARTVELNIVESGTLEFGEIEDVAPNAVEQVLSQYERKTNDIDAALPASRYRATFIGLSYPEVLDLSSSNRMNNLDGERMKWTIAFRHIKNQSIGPWKEWRYYTDPETGKTVTFSIAGPLPIGVTEDMVSVHTKFDDFMEKTSYLDLEYILWKILCATAMDKELISIDCHADVNGHECGKNYDWIYSPNELLMIQEVSPVVLEEMKTTATLNTMESIMENYKTAPINANNTVKLPHAGYQMIFGHANGKEYLNGIYSEIKKYDEVDETDPTFVSRGLNTSALTVVKGFLLPKPEGGWYRITGIKNILEIMATLDEVDWQVINEVCRMMEEPYTFAFALRDIVCPECGNRSSIPIDDMTQLLFIVARSLSSVQVELKKI